MDVDECEDVVDGDCDGVDDGDSDGDDVDETLFNNGSVGDCDGVDECISNDSGDVI